MQILEETYKLEFLYTGLDSRQVATIHHIRLQGKALQLILTAHTRQGSVHRYTQTPTLTVSVNTDYNCLESFVIPALDWTLSSAAVRSFCKTLSLFRGKFLLL